jgi:hypothetical protein
LMSMWAQEFSCISLIHLQLSIWMLLEQYFFYWCCICHPIFDNIWQYIFYVDKICAVVLCDGRFDALAHVFGNNRKHLPCLIYVRLFFVIMILMHWPPYIYGTCWWKLCWHVHVKLQVLETRTLDQIWGDLWTGSGIDVLSRVSVFSHSCALTKVYFFPNNLVLVWICL